MNCLAFRRDVMSDPSRALIDATRTHLAECPSCRKFYADIASLDRKIHRALSVEVPEGLAARALLRYAFNCRHRFLSRLGVGLAACFVAAALGIGAWRMNLPAIDDELLLAHVEKESTLVEQVAGSVQTAMIHKVLNEVRADTVTSLPDVTFAANCVVQGKLIAHLAIQSQGRRYTVLVIPHEAPYRPVWVERHGWRGKIAPHATGSLAVVTRRHEFDPDRITDIMEQFKRSLVKKI